MLLCESLSFLTGVESEARGDASDCRVGWGVRMSSSSTTHLEQITLASGKHVVLECDNDVLVGSKLEVVGHDLGLVLLNLVVVCTASL